MNRPRLLNWIGGLAALLCTVGIWSAERPIIDSVSREGDHTLLRATVPSGFRHVVLEERNGIDDPAGVSLVAGALDGAEALTIVRVPWADHARFLTLRVGKEAEVPDAIYDDPALLSVTPLSAVPLSEQERVGHVLNRVAYGPSAADREWVMSAGVAAYLEAQLQPTTIDESANTAWLEREAELFEWYQPRTETRLVRAGTVWRYLKGTQAPPGGWTAIGFDDSNWLEGPTGIGYGDGDDATVLDDMRQTDTQPGYWSVFLRHRFQLSDPALIDQLILTVDFDDGFVAYLNGVEVARENLVGSPPAHDTPASASHEAGEPVEFDLTPQIALLQSGDNVLAVQVHNQTLDSSDLSMVPVLLNRSPLPDPPQPRIRGLAALQQIPHVRGVYSRRQLQAVLGEFWENHFTTDADKFEDYLGSLSNSDASPAMASGQAASEAAQAEYEEYQFFYDHALGPFGDLLLYSASSPTMLVYLDNVLNRKGQPNENYAREIMELSAFGVDNRYTQQDIEELARCFTGWSVRKAWPHQRLDFPASVRTPLIEPDIQFDEEVGLDLGAVWSYWKGNAEPAPTPDGAPTLAWTQPDFDTAGWLTGPTGIGYGDDDDATVLTDMRGSYSSVYLRREFMIDNQEEAEALLLAVRYDDGFVAYVNGVELGRSTTMRGTGDPPPHTAFARGNHEASNDETTFRVATAAGALRYAPAVNVLALQAHNVSLNSSDLSILPRLLRRQLRPGSIEPGDPNGAWVFRFDPEGHDTAAKRLFAGTPYEINLPAGRTGADGVNDAIEVIDAMTTHPSTREFICLKLINRFVSDDIDLVSYRDGTAPAWLRTMLDDAMAAWMTTSPPGHIETVLRAILQPPSADHAFWSQAAYRTKIKTPVEFINANLRALNTSVTGVGLPGINAGLGMTLFTRDDPDGWSESGLDWMDTGTLLERVRFVQRLAGNLDRDLSWDALAWTETLPDRSAAGIIDAFDQLLYDGHLTARQRELLERFAHTDNLGNTIPFDPARADYRRRVQELVSLILALPLAHHQ